jgi:hypothetical protein
MVTDRRVQATVVITGQDYETFGSNEYLNSDDVHNTVLLTDSAPKELFKFKRSWGGECRAEVNTFIERRNDNSVHIYGDLKLFEGTSEDTDDHDGTCVIDFDCPKSTESNPNTVKEFTVRNTDEGDDDWAYIKLTVSNSRYVSDDE